jgi:ParB family chromosome partitioning protein
MKLPEGKSRLDLVKAGINSLNILPKRGRFIVSIHKLLEDPDNERRTFRGMDGLIASVKAHGIVEPITVTPEGEHFRILTGHRRYRAAKAIGLHEIEVIARDPEDALTRRRKSIISNVQREDIGAIEMAEALQTLLDEDKSIATQRQLAALIGKSEPWLSDMLRILTLSPKYQEQLRASELSVSYDSAMRIARCDPALQPDLIAAFLRGESTREIRSRIAESKDPSKGKQGRGANPTHSATPMFTFSETYEGCTATVRGPEGDHTRRHMRTAIKRLLKTLG